MNSKKYPIERLEEELTHEEERLQRCGQRIKSLRDEIPIEERRTITCAARISGLKDALHKLKGLDNLEKKNMIPDSAEMTEHQFLRKGPHRTQLKWKDVEDMEIRKFIKDFILPEITQLLKDRQYTFHEQLKEALK